MFIYVDSHTAYSGQVRKVILVHQVPAERSDCVRVTIDILEHIVSDRGMIRARRAPRITRSAIFNAAADDIARNAAQEIARAQNTPYICLTGDVFLPAMAVADAQRDAAD
jgi:hypothetical protein